MSNNNHTERPNNTLSRLDQDRRQKPNFRVLPVGANQIEDRHKSEAVMPIPHSPEAEEAVLGSLLIDREVISTVAPVLKPEHFFNQARAAIYQAMLNLYSDHTPADLVTVRNELKVLEVLGEGENQVKPGYLLELMKITPSPVHAAYYVEIVIKHWLARQIMQECATTFGTAQHGPGIHEPTQLLADHANRLQALSASLSSLSPAYFLSHEKSLDYPFGLDTPAISGSESNNDPWKSASGSKERSGLRFGWEAFDGRDWLEEPQMSLLPATLTTILARTGGGKTIAAMQIADANAKAGLSVLYFHVELNQEQMLARRYCRLTGIPVLRQLLKKVGDAERQTLVAAAAEVAGWPGRVDFIHCPNWGANRLINEIKARHYALMASTGHGYDLVILDYLQRLGRSTEGASRWSGGNQDERESLVYNVRAFSDCANELNIAALMTSQVGRNDQKQHEPPDLDEGLGTGDIERCSNQLFSLAISQDKSSVKWAIRKNTFGEGGSTGELLYDPRRLQFF